MPAPREQEFYDLELRAHHEHLRGAYRINAGDDVLDVGCGAGLTTREAARAATPGHAVGVDISSVMLERARRATAAEGVTNASYLLGDAQTYPFTPRSFDVAISRFGTMFFADPAAAFTNIASALRPQGRLVMLVWQGGAANEWAQVIDGALGNAVRPPAPGLDPFALSETDRTAHLLERAGFDSLAFADIRAPVFYGRAVEEALQTVCGFHATNAALATLDADARERTVRRLYEALAAHQDPVHGVVFAGASWLVTARRSAGA